MPYETLNKRFRAAQKNIDRETSHVTMVVAELEKTLSSCPAVDSVVSLLDGVVEKLSVLKRKVSAGSTAAGPRARPGLALRLARLRDGPPPGAAAAAAAAAAAGRAVPPPLLSALGSLSDWQAGLPAHAPVPAGPGHPGPGVPSPDRAARTSGTLILFSFPSKRHSGYLISGKDGYAH